VSAAPDRWIRWTTTGCVALLALIAGTVSYLHMHLLVELHGQPGWVAALTPLSVGGMIVAASTTLLADSRSGTRGGILPWALFLFRAVTTEQAKAGVGHPLCHLHLPTISRGHPMQAAEGPDRSELMSRPKISVQVLLLGASGPASLSGSFVLFNFVSERAVSSIFVGN
jgi:Protein of unknown function (DUF2637)